MMPRLRGSVAARTANIEFRRASDDAVAAVDGEGAVSSDEPDLIVGRPIVCATFIKGWWAERDGGLLIDQHPAATHDISRNAELPYGHVKVFAVDGEAVEVDVSEAPKDAVERWISEVISRVWSSS